MLSEGLDNKIAHGAIILDVRTPDEYATGHIAGSINISLAPFENDTELDLPKHILLLRLNGLRSVKVEHILREKGFQKSLQWRRLGRFRENCQRTKASIMVFVFKTNISNRWQTRRLCKQFEEQLQVSFEL
jgi:rhodanese-related sulfurtransferase